jgi:hypothetical protein
MEKAKRARKAETLKQPSLCLRLRAPYLYPDPTYSASSRGQQGLVTTCWTLQTRLKTEGGESPTGAAHEPIRAMTEE